MSIVVVGGTGRVGSKVVRALAARGRDVVVAAPSTGVDTVTGAGLADALAGASVVVDTSDAPSFDADVATLFFTESTTNLLRFGADAGVRFHIALSVVGTDRLAPLGGYFRAKQVQETLIADGPVPYCVLRSTQVFEFLNPTADFATEGDTVRLPSARIQPIASDDVAEAIAEIIDRDPPNGVIEVAGPETFRLDDVVRILLTAHRDARRVVADTAARFCGVELSESLCESAFLPADDAAVAAGRFADWVLRTAATR
ncbi:NmrA family transcriptional regulator [Mycolicibacterium agri]|uniref:LysR family transcriptional regulator n=1 Tax=Mycolicibacterium agri TaxID=36811 RepID=A0A2A7MTG5_MYCAG|nr:NAD(P)H-binding protein [Mycolicibacterium agri]PEG35015.1 NmrA family transcriptional regulator [Mycolicibacterium agri]GFG54095.1 LysR family transcriptional regulator [Mycolicibacterium agri]